MHFPGVVEAEAGEVGFDFAELAIGVASCNGGLVWDDLAGSFGVFACVMVGVEAIFGGEAAAASLEPPVTSQLLDCWEDVSGDSYEVVGVRLTVHGTALNRWARARGRTVPGAASTSGGWRGWADVGRAGSSVCLRWRGIVDFFG